eukprot:7816706-Pyramimonas_sp.AAC.1
MVLALGEAAGCVPPTPFKLGSGAGLWWSALFYSSPSTALPGGLLTWWDITVQWVCAEECT